MAWRAQSPRVCSGRDSHGSNWRSISFSSALVKLNFDGSKAWGVGEGRRVRVEEARKEDGKWSCCCLGPRELGGVSGSRSLWRTWRTLSMLNSVGRFFVARPSFS